MFFQLTARGRSVTRPSGHQFLHTVGGDLVFVGRIISATTARWAGEHGQR